MSNEVYRTRLSWMKAPVILPKQPTKQPKLPVGGKEQTGEEKVDGELTLELP